MQPLLGGYRGLPAGGRRCRVRGLKREMIGAGDPRPWFAGLLGIYLVCGLVFLGFARTPWQAGMVVVTSVVADFLAN